MSLSNAERQKRHRERLKARAALAVIPEAPANFTDVLDLKDCDGAEFLGWNRHEWMMEAPDPIIDMCGLRNAVDRWRLAEYSRLGRAADQLFKVRWHDIDAIRKSLGLKASKCDADDPYASVGSLRNKPPRGRE